MPKLGKSPESASFLEPDDLLWDDEAMVAETSPESAEGADRDLLTQGHATLQRLLGRNWEVSIRPERLSSGDGGDALLEIKSSDGVYVQMLTEIFRRMTPKDAEAAASKAALVRRVSQYTRLLLIAPWISPMTQEVLRQHDIDYLDLTGNISLSVTRPAIIIHTQGADRAPAGHHSTSKKPQLTGPRAGRLIRLLADVAPPYRATELAHYAQLSLPYVSRLLDTLDDLLLIRREKKLVVSVDWPQMLRARAAAQPDLLRATRATGMLAPQGVNVVLEQLKGFEYLGKPGVLVTGSHAARTVAPLSVGGQLMLYIPQAPENASDVGDELGLLPVDEGADVLLLHAPDLSVWQRALWLDGRWQTGFSQLVLDCLTGPGRMPAEGEHLIEFMTTHEDRWRKLSLSEAVDQQLF
ncbi:helix-turn-helix domain-containing protein [Streptomyces cinereoruber]|uniref:helix-turn-helix domain-containing protein n=1 Tax=Streptomyces cinereoruber TaxID=67260 RepID=UPI00363BC92A